MILTRLIIMMFLQNLIVPTHIDFFKRTIDLSSHIPWFGGKQKGYLERLGT